MALGGALLWGGGAVGRALPRGGGSAAEVGRALFRRCAARGSAGSSPTVRVAEAGGFGRGLWAARTLRSGEVVLEESPVASSPPALEGGGRVCWGCLRAVGSAPGAEVGGRAFCGEPCAAEARRWYLGPDLESTGAEERRFEELCERGGAGTLPLLVLRLARSVARGKHPPSVLDPLCFAAVPEASSRAAWAEPFEAARAVLSAETPGGAPNFFDFPWFAGVLGRLHVNSFRVDALGVADWKCLLAAAGCVGAEGGGSTPQIPRGATVRRPTSLRAF